MEKLQSYNVLKELFEDVFSDRSDTLNRELLSEILKATSDELLKISEELKLASNELSDFRLECIEVLAEMHYREGLNDDFTALLLKNESNEFKEHLTFLREMEAGIHHLERAQKLSELKELESSIEDREIEAAVTLKEREKLLEQFKEQEAQIRARASKIYASQPSMYGEERPAAAAQIGSNRSLFMRIAAILILVLIPTSIIIYFNKNNPASPNKKTVQTAKKEDVEKEDLLMGSSPDFSMDIKVPGIRTERMVLPIINEESFGFAQELDSIELVYQYYGAQNEYIENIRDTINQKLLVLDTMLLRETAKGTPGAGPTYKTRKGKDQKKRLEAEIAKIDSLYAQNMMKSNTYEYKNNKITIHFHCLKCAAINPETDDIEIRKEMEDLFLVINEDFEYLIEEGKHDLETE